MEQKEYCGKVPTCFEKRAPFCPAVAVIPTTTVESKTGVQGLENCVVRVTENNSLYYVDDKHRITLISSDPIDHDDYDFVNNPLRFRNQIVFDYVNSRAIYYDKTGNFFTLAGAPGDLTTFDVLTGRPKYAGVEMTSNTDIPRVVAGRNISVEEDTSNSTLTISADGLVIGYDTVADMKAATEVVNGSLVQTYGFYSKGDGGGAKYIIRTITNQDVVDEETIFALYDQTLVAELVAEDEMNILQFGIVGDGTTDLSTKLNKVLSYRGNNHIKINFNQGETYLAQNNVYLYSNTELNLNGATIKSCHDGDDTDYIEFGNGLRLLNNEASIETAGYGAIKNIEVYNGTFDGYESGVGIFILHGLNIKFHDLTFKDCCVGTHIFDLGGCKDVEIKNCNFDGYLITTHNTREMIQTDYATLSGLPYWGTDRPDFDGLPTTNMTIDGCEFSKGSGTYYPSAIGTHAGGDYSISHITIKNCIFNDTSYSCIRFVCSDYINIYNNKFVLNNGVGIRLQTYKYQIALSNVYIDNNEFNVTGVDHTPIIVTGTDHDGVITYANKINIVNNKCTGNWSNINNIDLSFITIGNAQNIIVNNNNVSGVKWFIIKSNNSYFKDSIVSNNMISYSNYFIACTNSDTSTYTEGSTGINESNNIWTDADNGTFNINNFKILLSCSNNLQASQASQSYYYMPLDENSSNIGEFVSNSNYQFALPNCIKKFKITGTFSIKCGSNTAEKILRLRSYDTQSTILTGAKKNYVADQSDTTTFSAIVDAGHILPSGTQYRVGMDAYLEQNDVINSKFGPAKLTTLLIEGF